NIDELTGFETRDMIVLPLQQWGRKPIGVLEVMNKRRGRLDQQDVSLLIIISALSTAAIEQVRLFEESKLAEMVHRLAGISHDVNNMLVPILMSRQMVTVELERLVGTLPPEQAAKAYPSLKLCHDALNTQREAAQRIQDRMQEVSDCVKGRRSLPEFTPCRVAEIVDGVVKILGFVADEKGLALRTEGLDGLPLIVADRRCLYSMFYNLVNNAIPEVPAGGAITVHGSLDKAGAAVLLSVMDTGRGMPKDVRDSLFTGRAVSHKAGGTGLGTKIVKDAVDVHGGQITVESQEGIGTKFLIRLPLEPPAQPSP
ncbi:MAG: HAMP domain-containing histidine kinase, partial [Nitrospirota bacterium]|nr:HAMP domain-containing histidine kinase [Nitrospirota bacterium]